MLELCEEYDIPATWAVVGHLMLESCDGRHEEHPAPDGWFDRERGEWTDREDLRFAPDLVDALLASPVDHEFASHSFSHVLFGDAATDHASRGPNSSEQRRLPMSGASQSTRSFIRETMSGIEMCWPSMDSLPIAGSRRRRTASAGL